MARHTLPTALALCFGSEGGYVNSATDRGGPTKYGITHKTLAAHRGVKSVTPAEVKAMKLEEAELIYRRSYWAQSGGDLLPAGLDYMTFDFGVHSGPQTAVKKLQEVLAAAGVYKGKIDGHIGEETLQAIMDYPGGIAQLISDYCDRRMKYMRSLGGKTGWSTNGRGWTIRVTGRDPKGIWKPQSGVIGNALRLARSADVVPEDTPKSVPAGKAVPQDTSLTEVLKKPEAWGPLTGLITGVGALASGSGPMQWALAAAMVAGACVGIWYFVRRVREQG